MLIELHKPFSHFTMLTMCWLPIYVWNNASSVKAVAEFSTSQTISGSKLMMKAGGLGTFCLHFPPAWLCKPQVRIDVHSHIVNICNELPSTVAEVTAIRRNW